MKMFKPFDHWLIVRLRQEDEELCLHSAADRFGPVWSS